MGACFVEGMIEAANVDELRAKFAAWQEQDRYENGHCYSGGIGMARGLAVGGAFDSLDAAREFVEQRAKKWEEALAVRVTSNGKSYWYIGAWCAS